MNTEHERIKFEAACHRHAEEAGHEGAAKLERDGDGYADPATQAAWWGWREGRAALQSHKPSVEFEDPRVQLVYGIICGGHEPPEGEHWDGYVSRLIVDALQSQYEIRLQVWRSTDSCMEFWSWEDVDQYDYDQAKPENRRIIQIVKEG